MRIVAGRWRGRQIETPDDDRVRPTTDKIREAWMSIVARDLPGARVLDLFAGSGALGLEALSRGAESVDFVDSAPTSLRLITRNVEGLGAGAAARVHRADGLRFVADLPARAYDVAFADPPYALDAAVRLAERWLEVPFADVLGVEHASSTRLPEGGERRRYGLTSITFYRRRD
ncbi:methyltransferase [Gemmatirosa kalamazoonensis]|uniref:Methyltransferase n=1 Tax=Gemmatirosa kalamazoonensis TaxID=861299 RepID=W0RKZ0_9BACT|nr:16S rRNA (guanine(966)-N(2))-methyltransferase RsmD [Gemmatirosa kalamazoonensis]AHG90995.1 methyltransferase [Gemmatirosa kalamazoonensis]